MPLTLVLLVRVDRASRVSDLDRFLAIGLPSLNRFFDRRAAAELLIVTPPEDVREVKRRVVPCSNFTVRVIDESTLCPELAAKRGWYKQQILKLGVAKLIRTEWYLTLDADVVCVRPINEDFLLPDGRALWQKEKALLHPEWWQGSASILSAEMTIASNDAVIGVTPAMMHTASTVALLGTLQVQHPGRAWATVLSDAQHLDWTEYSLYWTFLAIHGRTALLYSDSPCIPYATTSVWSAEEYHKISPSLLDAVFSEDAKHGFFVFQSRIDLPLKAAADLLRPRLGLRDPMPQDGQINSIRNWLRWKYYCLRRSVGNVIRRALNP